MTKLLPGQQLINGVSNLIFGTNTPNYDTSLISDTNIQNQLKAANITVIRAGFTDSSGNQYTDAQIDAQYNAIQSAGAVMLGLSRIINPHLRSMWYLISVRVVSCMSTRMSLISAMVSPSRHTPTNGIKSYHS